jgi:hypothetical protein
MSRLSGLRWKRREIRAYVVSSVRFPFSEPLTLWIGKTRENAAYQTTTLIHELGHTLMEDNREALIGYWRALESTYRAENDTTLTHIPVEALVIETLKSVFEKDSERYIRHEKWWDWSKANPEMKESYARAWRIVVDMGPRNVLKQVSKASQALTR